MYLTATWIVTKLIFLIKTTSHGFHTNHNILGRVIKIGVLKKKNKNHNFLLLTRTRLQKT